MIFSDDILIIITTCHYRESITYIILDYWSRHNCHRNNILRTHQSRESTDH
ncbi:hypothetical protein GBAR_LOCUS23578 [Geodia barretti]|uniref:Uncharacterized protein n=1 Tax=Geodia barretti TaxID=519541 RepID=A0AA35T824_GEOBA|nr:hypothetical protein GBAR_LOCUS23578 [Geodia barretti]